jgi:class 3 adenylate cyclase
MAAAKKIDDHQVRLVDTSCSETIEGEGKTVTAMSADIKGSTELMEDLDPEEARDHRPGAEADDRRGPASSRICRAIDRRWNFRAIRCAVAHEDHPQRALYASLRMQEEMRRYSSRLREAAKLRIEARVGVNTGEVVLGRIATGSAKTEYTPIAHTANLAARMQAVAATGSIAVSEN